MADDPRRPGSRGQPPGAAAPPSTGQPDGNKPPTPAASAEAPLAPTPFDQDDQSWEADLDAWDAAIPVVTRGSGPAPSGTGDALGAVPDEENPFAETPTTVVGPGEVRDMDDLPDLIPSGAFDAGVDPASGSYAALITTDESAPSVFDREPKAEPAPVFPSRTLPEMDAARWTAALDGLVAPGSARTPTAPDLAYLQGLGALLADERVHERTSEKNTPRAVALAVAAARVAELGNDFEQARAHIEGALARDGTSTVAHRARWLLAERVGELDDEGAVESLSRLALLPHPDQSYYRALKAEWALARAARGITDATAPALITAAPEGVGRLLAEAELSWRQPAVAAALVENAAHRLGGDVGAALMACAAQLNEAGKDFQAAAEQRFVAARMEEHRAPAPAGGVGAPAAMGMIRDIARLEPVAAVPALEVLLGSLPPSALKVAVARWGAAAARRTGEAARAWRFVADVGHLAPANLPPETAALLVRDRMDLWPGKGAPAPDSPRGGGFTAFTALTAPVAAAWPSAVARTCLTLHAGSQLRPGDDATPFVGAVETLLAEAPDSPALAPALEAAVVDAPVALRQRVLAVQRRIDPARWVPASLDLVDGLATLSGGAEISAGAERQGADGVLRELAERHPSGLAFWRAAAAQASGRASAAAAATLDGALASAPWRDSPLAVPLAELAAELLAETDPAAAAARLAAALPKTNADLTAGPAHVPQAATLGRVLRRSRDRAQWAAFVAGALPAAASEPGARIRRAAMLLEPIFWKVPTGATADEAVSSLLAAALQLVPLHPTAWALLLGARPAVAALVEPLVFAAAQPGGGPRTVLMAAAASVLADAPGRALALARQALAMATGETTYRRAAAALTRRLSWAAPNPEARAAILRELAETGDAAALVEAAESAEKRQGAAALFARARAAEGADAVLADVDAGEQRLEVPHHGRRRGDGRAQGPAGPDGPRHGQGGDAPAMQADHARADDRLAALEDAARGGRWPDVVTRLVDAPPHEASAGATTLALAAELDEGRAGGTVAPELWSAARIAFAAASAGGAAPGELGTLFRAEEAKSIDVTAAGEALERLADVSVSLSTATADDGRSAALFLVEAANHASGDTAERRLRAALERDPASAPVALAWRRWLTRAGRIDEAAAAAAAEAEALADPELRVQALLRGAALLGATPASGPTAAIPSFIGDERIESLDNTGVPAGSGPTPPGSRIDRAAAYLTRALELAPQDHDAFARLRTLYEESGRAAPLAELLGVRLNATTNPFEVTALRLARTELFAGPLGDRARARTELEAILLKEPHHARALGRLADLEQEDGNHAGAAELLIRQAFIERSPAKLRDLFLRLGRIYSQNTPDPKRAIGAYSRVLQLDAANHEALEELSRLYLGLGENKNAVSMTERLIQTETVPARRSAYHIRLGHLAERGGDVRTAGQHFRKAVDEAPRDVEALGELVRHLEKARDTVGRRHLLDRAAADLRTGVLAAPADGTLLAALIAVSRWRGRAATAAAAAELRALTDTADDGLPDWAAPPPQGRRVAALANPAVDEQTFGAAVPPSVRHLFRVLGASLWEGTRPDLARLGVDRADKIAPGRPPRDIVDPIGAELAAGPFDLYVPAARSSAAPPLLVDPGKTPTIIMGAALVRLGSHAVRFMAARSLRLVATHLDVALAGDPTELGAWLAGIIRQYIPDYRHPSVPVEVAAARSARVAKLLPRKLRQEVMPFAMESSGALDLAALYAGIRDGANRVGLLASGSLGAGLRVLLGAAGAGVDGRLSTGAIKRDAQAMALVSFALSDEYDDLVRALE